MKFLLVSFFIFFLFYRYKFNFQNLLYVKVIVKQLKTNLS